MLMKEEPLSKWMYASIVTLELDLSKVGGVLEGTAANIGYTEAAALPCSNWLPAGLDLQTLAKCPLF